MSLAPQSELKGLKYAKKIQDAGSGDEPGSVIASGARDIGAGGIDRMSHEIEDASAQIGEKSEHSEGIAAIGKDVAAKTQAHDGESSDSEEVADSLAPFAKQKVAETGDEPCCNGGENRQGLIPYCGVLLSFGHGFQLRSGKMPVCTGPVTWASESST
jgi:hypothetical protein